MNNLAVQSFVGFFFLILVAFLFSDNRRKINWRLIIVALIAQNILYLMINYIPAISYTIATISATVVKLLDFSHQGASFIFGNIANTQQMGFIFLIAVVPTIIFFGALISILYFFGIIQKIIAVLALVLQKTIKLSAPESLVVIADIFLGQNEGPMVIGPYISTMTRAQLACAFIAGLANVAGSTLGMYLTFIAGDNHAEMLVFGNYLVTATLMNALSAIIFAKLLFPDESPIESTKIQANSQSSDNHNLSGSSFIESLVQGAMTGMKIGVAVITILIAVIPLIQLIDFGLAKLGYFIHLNNLINLSTNGVFHSLSLEYILGQIFRVFAFFMGIDWGQTISVGSLLGQKVAINEFVAYMSLGQMKAQHLIDLHSIYVSTFALASFSNFSSIGISMGAFSILAPSKQKELASIAFKALFAAVLAGFMTATTAGFWQSVLAIH